MKPWLVAHRGAPHHAQENTVEAFQVAQTFKIGYIEFDVRVTSDNQAVVHHDPTINGLDIDKLTLAELRAEDPKLATLQETMQTCKNMPLIIELKSSGVAKHIAPYLLKSTGNFATSFYYDELEILASLGVPKNQMFLGQKRHAFGLLGKVTTHGFGGISVNAFYLNPWLYRRAKMKHLRVLSYTVNSLIWAQIIRKWLPEVLICTNRPDKLIELN